MLQANILTALGTMSGTSLDGVDAAIVETDGHTITRFGPSSYRPYSPGERTVLRQSLGLWQSDDVEAAAQIIETAHLAIMRGMGAADIAGFHGQTLAHDPGGHGTHQCGNGERIADALGYPVAWDFRSADVRGGGQGAPLAPFFHFALAKWLHADAPVAFLNLGGVGNITWVDPTKDDPSEPGALLAFDTGPANAPINDAMVSRFGLEFDEGGQVAAQGKIANTVISSFIEHPYFAKIPPKSLDRDAFAGLTKDVRQLTDEDAIATLTQAVVASVTQGVAQCPSTPMTLLVSGGGRKNKTIMQGLGAALNTDVATVDSVGLDGDMLEAQAFAFLAVRVARGLPLSAPKTTGVNAPLAGGLLALPSKSDNKKP